MTKLVLGVVAGDNGIGNYLSFAGQPMISAEQPGLPMLLVSLSFNLTLLNFNWSIWINKTSDLNATRVDRQRGKRA